MPKAYFLFAIVCFSPIFLVAQGQSTEPRDFVITNTNDTIYGEKVRILRILANLGKATIINNEEKRVFGYNELYQIHFLSKRGEYNIYEMVQEFLGHENSYELMEIVNNVGKVKLYLSELPDYDEYFVVSEHFHGYIHRKKDFERLMAIFLNCKDFQRQYPEKKNRRKKDLEQLVEFYNQNCSN